MSKPIIAAIVGAAILLAVPVAIADAEEAICPDGPRERWASDTAVSEKLKAMIDKEFALGLDKGCYEAEVMIDDDTMIDIYVDPVTTEVVRIRTAGEEDS
ncbi:MAG: PepSY domain-containing protein [Dongiaceae bacterium]